MHIILRYWRRTGVLLLLLLLVAGQGCVTAIRAKSGVPAVAEMETAIARVYPAIVRLDVVSERAADGRMRKVRGFGSGVIIREDGYLVTNHHVAGRASRIMCRLADGEEVEGVVVGTDPLADVTVVRLRMEQRRSTKPLTVAEFGDSDALRVGDPVLAMGSPGGIAQSVTRGIVSNLALILPGGALNLDGEAVGSLVRWIAHDARIFGGNSGGPLVSLDGRIVGINEIAFAGIGGAIPGNLAKSVAEQLMENGQVTRSHLGLSIQPRPKSLGLERGALVANVMPETAAAEAGLRAGDVLLRFDGVEVNCAMQEDVPVFNMRVLSTPIGKEVVVGFLRDGVEQEVRLVTRRREAARGRDRELDGWGMTARDFTAYSAAAALRDTTDGVLVSSVSASGAVAQADPPLRPGDVIVAVESRPVTDVADLLSITGELLEGREEARPLLTAFERGRNHFLSVVRVGPAPQPDNPERSKRPDFPAVLQAVSSPLAEALDLPDTGGLRVVYVFPTLSVDQAGVQTGDILTRFDGNPVQARSQVDVTQFTRRVRAGKVGATVPLEVWRQGESLTLELTLAESQDETSEENRMEAEALRFHVRTLSLLDRALRKLPQELQGVLVERVESASAAELAGLRAGDLLLAIQQTPMVDMAALKTALDEIEETKPAFVLLFIRRGV